MSAAQSLENNVQQFLVGLLSPTKLMLTITLTDLMGLSKSRRIGGEPGNYWRVFGVFNTTKEAVNYMALNHFYVQIG